MNVRSIGPCALAMALAVFTGLAAGPIPPSAGQEAGQAPDLGVEVADLMPVVDNPLTAFGGLKRAVYAGKERDPDTGRAFKVRMEVSVRDSVETLAGVKVTVVEVAEFEGEDLVSRSRDYYAQHRSGAVYYLGSRVDDYEDGKIVGHEGQWLAGERGNQAGLFMPAAPKVGDVFQQARAPGVAETRAKVLAVGRTLKVPAGTFKDCIETEDYDPLEKATARSCYCPGVGLVKTFSPDRTVELVSREGR